LTGGLRLRFGGAPQHERSWAEGADGEREVAASLERRCRPEVMLLHDRGIPGSRANIDHIAVAPAGLWLIDAKNHRGKLRVHRPLLGRPKLTIGGRDWTKLTEGLLRQVEIVRGIISGIDSSVPVHGALCFPRVDLPLLGILRGGSLCFDGVPIVYRKALTRRLNEDGPITRERAELLAMQLAERLPQA
jgi:hypothetical protein